jgi:chromosome segregation ATPase
MDDPITRAEHEEFRRRIEEENKRQDRRLELLEHTVQQISDLTTSVEKLAVSMEGMLREQEKQGTRLETLEDRDGEMWRKIIGYAATAAVGIIIGYVARQIGLS